MNRQLWTISNSLSVLRIVLVVPLALSISSDAPGNRLYAVGLIIAAALTDFLDGFFARKLDQITDVGKIIDPLADKIAVGVVCIVLAVQGEMPLWYLIVAIARDVLILLGGVYLKNKKGILLQSNIIGKWTVVIVTMYIFLLVLRSDALVWLSGMLLILSTVMLLISFVMYVLRFMRTISSVEMQSNVQM